MPRADAMRWSTGPAPVAPLANVVEQQHIVVCCGTGGVGKTTTAAVFAIEAAKRGRNAVVVTIDPAKRLADTLGVEHAGSCRAGDRPPALGSRRARRRARGGSRPSCSTPRPRSTASSCATRRTRSRPSASSTTASTATSPARSRGPRNTWRWRSCTSCTRTAATTSSSSTRRRRATPSTSSTRRTG